MDTITRLRKLLHYSFQKSEISQVSYFAAALSYYTIFSLPAAGYVVVTVGSMIFGSDVVHQQLVAYFVKYVGQGSAELFDQVIRFMEISSQGTIATIIGVLVLLYAATNLFTHIQGAVEYILKSRDPGEDVLPKMVRRRARSFIFIMAAVVMLFAMVFVNALVAFSTKIAYVALGETVSLYYISFMNFAVSFVAVGLLFSIIYKLFSTGRMSWRACFGGGSLAALFFILMNIVLSLYFTYSHSALYIGVAGSVLITLLWVYYVAYVFLIGAEMAKALQNKRYLAL